MDTCELISPSPDGDYGSPEHQQYQGQSASSCSTQPNQNQTRNLESPQPQYTGQIPCSVSGPHSVSNSFNRNRSLHSSSHLPYEALAEHHQTKDQAPHHRPFYSDSQTSTQRQDAFRHGYNGGGQCRLQTRPLAKSSTLVHAVGRAIKHITPAVHVQQPNTIVSFQPEHEIPGQSLAPAPIPDATISRIPPEQSPSGYIVGRAPNRSHDRQVRKDTERSQVRSSTDRVRKLIRSSEKSSSRSKYSSVPHNVRFVDGSPASQTDPPYRSPYVNDQIIIGPRSLAHGSIKPTRLLNPPMVPSNMPPNIEENSNQAMVEFPVRNAASLLNESRIVPLQHQHYRHFTSYQDARLDYSVDNGQRHPQQSLRRPSQTGQPAAIAMASENLLGWKNAVSYMPVAQQRGGNNGLLHSQRSLGFNSLALPPSHDGLPRYDDNKSTQMSVIIPSPRSKTSWPQTPERLGSGSNSPPRNRPSSNLISKTPRVEIPVMSSDNGGWTQTDIYPTRFEQPLAKKRGRPFATPQAAAKAAAKMGARTAGESNPSRDGFLKKRGRPFKAPRTQDDVAGPEPTFNVFVCEWKDCLAELHNAGTLRLHLEIVHCKRDSSTKMLPCLWRQCKEGTKEIFNAETKTSTQNVQKVGFKTRKAWEDHIETAHILPVLWHQGDGPKGTDLRPAVRLTEKEASPWLYDAEGRQITPSVKGQKVETGTARENNQKRFKKARDGVHVVFEPIDGSRTRKTENADNERQIDDSDGDGDGMDVN